MCVLLTLQKYSVQFSYSRSHCDLTHFVLLQLLLLQALPCCSCNFAKYRLKCTAAHLAYNLAIVWRSETVAGRPRYDPPRIPLLRLAGLLGFFLKPLLEPIRSAGFAPFRILVLYWHGDEPRAAFAYRKSDTELSSLFLLGGFFALTLIE